MMRRLGLLIALGACLFSGRPSPLIAADSFPGGTSDWFGYTKYDFNFDGKDCCVVEPKTTAPGKPWIWRARFWGHEPQTDLALLAEGFHVAYMDVANLFGNPEAVAHWNAFYDYLTAEHGFAVRPALEGMSRGGLIVYNWAAANPDRVACIYADAPVCDIKSWPGGLGEGTGNSEMWPLCLEAYGLTDETVKTFKGNPIDHLEPLAKAGVPLLHICGDADQGVPLSENTAILAERYRALEGPIKLIIKAGVGHHPHSLEDPAPIVRFILRNTCGKDPFMDLRSSLKNSYIRFQKEKKGRVAFLGGSITEGDGWRDLVCEGLQKRFPDTEFDFINAGISSTDSTLGAFRLSRDVFGRGQVDLLFLDSAVNDQYNGRTETESIRGVEGIIRHARKIQPEIDIVIQYFVDPPKMEWIRKGEVPPVIAAQEKVAEHYKIPMIDQAASVTERIDSGEFTWATFKDLHPSPFGHRVYARAIDRLFDTAWNLDLEPDAETTPHEPLPEPVDALNYENGRYVEISQAKLGEGWSLVPSWEPKDQAGRRKQFTHVPMLVAEQPGAELELEFSGTAIGLLEVAGPDVGVLEYSVDGAPPKQLEQFTEWSERLHIPWAYMLEADLDPGDHRLILRTTDKKNEASGGHAIRIVQFLAN
ncbi:MAG: prolyl oligopeptidase family serine peptidase [Candidatus Omnitrophica bacterium]|nr:prolyl oligopeptidase family serine peptidase [Candidatus Omnitrophota bacterium]